MGNQAIPFHLTHSQSPISCSAFHRLACEHSNRTPRTGVYFIIDEVLQSLVESWAQENLGVDCPPGVSRVHDFVAVTVVTEFMQNCCDVINRNISEWGGISFLARECPDLRL